MKYTARKPGIYTLKSDPDFKVLCMPLRANDYQKTVTRVRNEPGRNPVVAWNGVIIEGYDRYEICCKENIPFVVFDTEFNYKEEAIAWACASRLKQRGLSDEAKRFLIGLQYEAEKVLTSIVLQKRRENPDLVPTDDDDYDIRSGHRTAMRIAADNHISWNTVHKYSNYARAILTIGEKVPDVMPRILAGRYRISFDNMIELSKRSPERIRAIIDRLETTSVPVRQYKNSRREIQDDEELGQVRSERSVKDMPEYDPDAEITALTLTIPTWKSSVERIKSTTDFGSVSEAARKRLQTALSDLNTCVELLLSLIQEGE